MIFALYPEINLGERDKLRKGKALIQYFVIGQIEFKEAMRILLLFSGFNPRGIVKLKSEINFCFSLCRFNDSQDLRA